MAENSLTVDYKDMGTRAATIRELGKDLNTQVTKIYNAIDGMRNVWYGKRYNELVKKFNDMIPQINYVLKLVVRKLPYNLEQIANNYSNADRKVNITTAIEEFPNLIEEIALSNNEGMRFKEAEVEEIRKNVSTYFSNVIDKMNSIATEFDLIIWESTSATTFRTKFSRIKSGISSSFQSTKTAFVNIMKQAEEDMQAAETANTVD